MRGIRSAGRPTRVWCTVGSSRTARRTPTGRRPGRTLTRTAMFWLLLASLPWISPAQTSAGTDVSALHVTAPTVVAELDLGSLKGDLRQIGWSPDQSQLYVQTAAGRAPPPAIRHYLVAVSGGAITSSAAAPAWAQDYWSYKSDRFAPGIGHVRADGSQPLEHVKAGPGSARRDE